VQRKPLWIILSACLFLYFPIEFIIASVRGAHFPWPDVLLSLICPLILLVGLIRVTRVGWYTLVALISLWGIRDLHDYYTSRGASFFALLAHIGIYSISLGYFINPRIRHLYFDPKLQWWRTKRRYETHMPLMMRHEGVWFYPILRNISEGGCFIEITQPLAMNSTVEISIPLPAPLNVSVIKTQGEVRWVSHDPRRTGIGVQFSHTSDEQLLAIKEFTLRF
jgi:hypothetical protein